MRAIVATAAALLVLCGLAASSARASIYWGGVLHGEVYGETGSAPANQAAWAGFERHAGKEVTLLSMGQRWDRFDTARFQAARDGGAIPLVVMALPDDATLAEVAAGEHDAVIRSWAREARSWAHPFLFAPWWEMNGGWFHWGRDPSFVAAWRRFHDLVLEEGATNVTWAWVPNSIWADPESDPLPYYPGDAYVDWVGFDVYNWGRNPLQPDRWLSPAQTMTPIVRRLKEIAPGKPIVVAENAATEIGGNKAAWIEDLLTTYLPHHPEIKAYAWFNWNIFDVTGRWDWQIESSAAAQQAFRRSIQSAYYRTTLPAMAPLSKVPVPSSSPLGGEPGSGDLSEAAPSAGRPSLASGPDGGAVVAWERFDGSNFIVEARRIGPNGVASPAAARLSGSGANAFSPRAAVGPDGTGTATWIRFDGTTFVVEAQQVTPSGGVVGVVGVVERLSAPGRNAAEPDVAVGADGVATVVWSRFDGSRFVIETRRLAGDGALLGEPQRLSEPGQNAWEPRVAVGPSGTATVAWTRHDGANEVVEARRVEPDGSPSTTTHQLTATGQDASEVEVAVGPEDVATVVWSRSNGSDSHIQARRIAADDSLGSTMDLSASGADAAEPALSPAPNGAVTVAWTRWNGTSFAVQARQISAASAPGPTRTLSTSGEDAVEPDVAALEGGDAAIVWTLGGASEALVQERLLRGDGTLSPLVGRSSPDARLGAPAVAAGDGRATIVWRRSEPAGDTIQGTLVAPPVSPGEPPEEPGGSDGTSGGTAADVPAAGVTTPTSGHRANPPSATLRIGRARLNRRRGTARLPVTVTTAGTLTLGGRSILSAGPRLRASGRSRPARVLRRGGTALLPIIPKRGAGRLLSARGRLRVRVVVTYDPVGAPPLRRRASIVLRRSGG